MSKKDSDIVELKDLDKLRSAPNLNKKQEELLFKEVKQIILNSDWLTIGIMSPSLEKGVNAVRKIEEAFNYNMAKPINLPESNGPVFLKANQKTGEMHARIEYGLGEGILITCHNNDDSLTSKTIGPFPLDFFNKKL
ncbi:DUF1824 family protein [Prochlorococcus marinus]|uniref:DUF1824 domain-containing protein n=1 Tax=Prochlorococcus marinus XMU1408 TaxID=2213228 RepID=A0A318R5H5_PROMR|nr:DUF1824 family protein [Prochlorococcus marinus]MBW3041715.1 DUF1824 domain-containing protein [Prochlorococcus marinus str. XMU1408]PYE02862.1 DUF1824 domain-containing protein [Prochlorococcus marinus XMU1408]